MRIILIVITIFISTDLFSNGMQESLSEEIKIELAQADKIEISFGWWGNDGFDIEIPEVTITNKEEIQNAAMFFTDTPSEIAECGYDCEVVFYKNETSILNKPILVNFSCSRQIVYNYKGLQRCIRMDSRAIKYLTQLYMDLLKNQNNNDI